MIAESMAATGVIVAVSEATDDGLPSGIPEERGDDELGELRVLPGLLPGLAAGGGTGGRPPLPRPFRMLRVSVRRC